MTARFRSVLFDCDSTLADVEGIDELAREHRAAVAELTGRAMTGDLPLEEVYARRLELARPGRAELRSLALRYVDGLVPGARETVAGLLAAGVDVRIVSGGLRPAVLAVGEALGIPADRVYAVGVSVDAEGNYAGFEADSLLARAGGKRVLVEGLDGLPRPTLLVGDGATDLEARPAVDAFACFTGVARRATIAAAADYVITDLREVLAIVGVAPSTFDLRPSTFDRIPVTTTAPAAAGFGRFFLPGPTEVHPDVLAAQTRPMIGHRGKGMEELLARLQPGLQALFRTARPVYLGACSATGFMEGAVRNCAGARVLALVNGAFSERFFRIAQANGVAADALTVEWGEAHDPARVAEALARRPYDAVTVVHSETSTGVLNPVAELATVCRQAGEVLLLVDSVSGVAGAPVEPDAWGLDLVLTGSQKALALPPGLALGVLQPAALARAERTPSRGTYFDFLEYEAAARKHQTVNTPAISLLYALEAQLARIAAEGVEARWARHRALAERTWSWVEEMRGRGAVEGVLAPAGFRAPTVTCIRLAGGRTGPAVAAAAKARGFVIGTGYGKLKDSTFRIGHMGDHSPAGLDDLLGALTEVLS